MRVKIKETGFENRFFRKAFLPFLIFLICLPLFQWNPALAATTVTVNGPGGKASQSLPDLGGSFDLNIPLTKNAINTIIVTAVDAYGNKVSQEIPITQVSLDSIVVSKVTTERLSVQQVEQLVSEGVIKLDNPANYNVSKFDIVLTIAQQPVAISIPVASPKEVEQTGYEIYKLPKDQWGWGPKQPQEEKPQIIVFEQKVTVQSQPEPVSIPGVIIIEGRIKSLKEFYNVRLLLMNTSGIFTLKDVMSNIEFPDGGLTKILPADGIISFGNILPGDGGQPGQVEKQFTIRGDEIGLRRVKVNFGGTIAGPGIPEDKAIPFNGSAFSDVEVKGPPTFKVQVFHPDTVAVNVPYELKVNITNTGDVPAMYASLELDVGADAELVKCDNTSGTPVCTRIKGSDIRSFGHILQGETVSETFTINPLMSGIISSCVGVADQNISLQVYVGTLGCIVGQFPPERGVPEGIPTVTVVPVANAFGISIDSPVTAFFSKAMNEGTITTGTGGTFNVYDRSNRLIPGQIRLITLNEKTVAVWQVDDQTIGNRLLPKTEHMVVLTRDIIDKVGNRLYNEWTSRFTTTDMGINDTTPPTLTLSVEPPVNPNYVLPGQIIKVDAYAADQGSGVARVELRTKDLSETGAPYILVDQKTVFNGNLPPYIFSIDSANLILGHTYQLMGTAYDGMGNTQNATISVTIATSSDPPTITLPEDPTLPVLQGISVSLTPVQLTGGVKEVRYYLDGNSNPYKTVTLAPYQAGLATLNLTLGPHTIRAVAVDGLGQMGEDTYAFNLVQNLNMPTVQILGTTSGAKYVTGSSFTMRGDASDPVGIDSVKFYLDTTSPSATPIATGTQAFTVNTTGLNEGLHTIYMKATNTLGISNDLSGPASSVQFSVVPLPNGPPPSSPSVTLAYPDNGKVTFNGTSVAGARIDITNTTLGLTITVNANANGVFSGQITADAGNILSLVAYDFSTSQQPSTAATATVQAPPVLVNITVDPAIINFTSVNAYQDIVVTGYYQDGSKANLTSKATFSSNNAAVSSVNSGGRVVALSNGSAVITAAVNGRQTQVSVSVSVVTLTNITVDPSQVNFIAVGQTRQLVVTAHYSDNTAQPITSGITYSTGNPNVATVSSSGLVTAKGDGNTQISVSKTGVTPVTVDVSVNTASDPAPTVTILSPASGTDVERKQAVSVNVRAQDTLGGVTKIFLEVTGQTTYSEMKQISPASLDVTRTFNFTVSDTAAAGGAISVSARAEDTSGNSSQIAAITLNVVDLTAPMVSITQPAAQTPFNYGDTVNIAVLASDDVGVTQIRFEASGALNYSGSQDINPPATATNTSFSFVIPYGVKNPDVRIVAYARDMAGNERASLPVDIVLTDADITPPETVVTSVAAPGSGASSTATYQVTSGLEDLDYVLLYFRRNGIGTFNRYTDADGGNPEGKYLPQTGNIGTIVFNSTKMGGDGTYEFYSVGVDKTGNKEAAPKDGSGNVVPDQTTVFNAGTAWTIVTSPLLIGEGDTSYDSRNLRIIGTTLTVNGLHQFKNVELLSGAVLTHPETSTTLEYGINLDLWTLTVDNTSSINVNGKGYVGGQGTGDACKGRTVGNTYGSTFRSGGSYGGSGGSYSGGTPNPIYGNFVMPADLGSGGSCGGSNNNAGGDGGGRIQIKAVNLISDGNLSANGTNGTGYQAGSGSGGSLYLITSTLSGNGLISANGAAYEVGGGGGRIAVHFIDLSTKEQSKIQTLGGQGNYAKAGNGTVFLKSVSETGGSLVVDGQNTTDPYTYLPIPPGYVFDNIVLRNNARVLTDTPLVVNDTLSISTGSILSHTQGSEAGLSIQAKRVEVEGTGSIDVTAKGYRGGSGSGSCEGITLGGLTGARFRAGGSYGGSGGVYSDSEAATNLPYSHPAEPLYLGSGGSCGGSNSNAGGHGGGLVKITATEAVVINGSIKADGGPGTGYQAGSGSGGSVWINTSLFSGTGTISANGGVYEVGGGGGRVAVFYDYLGDTADFGTLRQITAFGGHGNYRQGSAGTVLLKRSDQPFGDLYVDDNVTGSTSSVSTEMTHIGYGKVMALTADTITTDGTVKMMPNGLKGLEINPNLNQTLTYQVVSNTENTITVSLAGGKPNLTAIAAVNDTYAGIYRFDNVYFRRGGFLFVGDPLMIGNTLRIDEYGRLTHYDTTLNYETLLDLNVGGTLEITSTGSINVDGRGYVGGQGAGDACRGRTVGNTYGSTFRSGGSYGGLGGSYSGGIPNPVYGSFTDPGDLGSGGSCGGNNSNAGGDGGGWVNIQAGTVVLDGLITANGTNGTGYQAGSGSGGTVKITAPSISGTGMITANGAAYEVGGGGGRIAIIYHQSFGLSQSNLKAVGGQGNYGQGGNGTVFLKGPSQNYGDLYIDGFGGSSPVESTIIPPGYVFDNVVLRNNARVLTDAPLVVNNTLSISTGSKLTHSVGSEAGLDIRGRRVELDGTSSIDVSAKGYRGGAGNGTCEGITLGGLTGAQYRSGGTYGGSGGVYGGTGTNLPYGHPAEPFYLGSGGSCGGNNSNGGGYGGGLVKITATEATVINGSIKADGGTGTGYQAGSGSGGSIWISTPLFTGTGTISANGGVYEVGGGGGRIAVFYDSLGNITDFGSLRQITAFGGHGNYGQGSAGTVLLKQSDQSLGDLYIDDNMTASTASNSTALTHIGYGKIMALTADTITTNGVVKMVPNGLKGLEINPNLNQTQTYQVVSNTENTITVSLVGKPGLTSLAAVNDTYAGIYRFDNVYFRRGGYLIMGGPLLVSGTLQLDEYGKVTHYDATLNFESLLDLTVGNLEITSTGSINVDGRGYVGGQGAGDACRGRTIGNTLGSTYRSGGSYGGLGGSYSGGTPNPVYSISTDPEGLGSGGSCGGNNSNAGGDGGGWVNIQAGTFVLDGLITANGTNGTGYQAGSGSGGTVYINASSISGAGTIKANGAANEVGGGGGRIGIIYHQTFGLNQTNLQVTGGNGNYADGQNGTVHIEQR